jgi:hypothetical protein
MTTPVETNRRPRLRAPGSAVRLRPYFVYARPAEGDRMVPDPEIPVIVLADDRIQVGKQLILGVDYGRTTVSWSHMQSGWVSSGHLFFSADGVHCHGNVAIGPSAAEAVARPIFASALPPSAYGTLITTQRYPAGTDPASLPDSAWEAGLRVDLGYRLDPGTGFPQTYVGIDGRDLSDYVGLSVNANDDLVLQLEADSDAAVLCAVDSSLLLSQVITFSTFGEKFAGTVQATCADQAGVGAYLCQGSALSHRAAPHASEVVAAMAGAAAPSLAELLSLVPDQSVSDSTNALLVENMKWAISRSDAEKAWLTDFFVEQPPVLPASRTDLIEKDLGWYQQQLSLGYLSYGLDGLTGPAEPAVHLDADQRARLKAFLETGLGQSTPFARQMEGLFQSAFLAAKPRLAAYLADGETWAATLLDYVGSDAALTNMSNRIAATNDATGASNITSLLQTLDPSGASAKTYQQRLIGNLLLSASLQTSVQDEDWTMQWLPDALMAFVEQYAPGPAQPMAAAEGPADDRAKVAANLKDAAEFFGSFTELAKEISKIFVRVKGLPLMRQGEEATAAFARKYPRFATAANVMFLIAWAGGVFSVIVAFVDWDELSPTEKAAAINKTISLTGDAAEAIVGLLKPKPTMNDYLELVDFTAREDTIERVGQIGRDLAGEDEFLARGIDETTALFDAESRTIAAEGTVWVKVLTGAEKVLGWLGVAVSAVATVLSFVDFVNDITKGDVSKAVLDGILTAANAAMTVALVLGIVLESTIAMIAASVFCVVGLVITIIEIFMPEPKTPTPADTFMAQSAVPFVNSLPAPATAAV